MQFKYESKKILKWKPGQYFVKQEFDMDAEKEDQKEYIPNTWGISAIRIAKAQEVKKEPTQLPPQYQEYQDVFDK